MKVYLGVYKKYQADHLPRFMFSFHQLRQYKKPLSFGKGKEWILDSGAFTELNLNGKYTYTVDDYLQCVEKHQPSLFFNMDYMCEPFVLKKTGKTVLQHQLLTMNHQAEIMDKLKRYNISGTFAGVIQGYTLDDYLQHIDLLKDHDLMLPKMGIGSICRRTSPTQIVTILLEIKKELPNVKLHAFGVKLNIFTQEPKTIDYLDSCDTMAWSIAGRYVTSRPCGDKCILPNQHQCTNCWKFMLNYYSKITAFQGVEV